MFDELDFALDAKTIDDEGNIEGLAVGYGDVDHGGDRVMPGAITASVASRKSLPMLLYHDQRRPVGVWNSFREASDGLHVKGRFAMGTRYGKEAHALVQAGALSGLSMGYKTLRHSFEGKTRQLHEVGLHEISLVTIPMHDRARVMSVKDIMAEGSMPTVRQFEAWLRDAGGFSKSLAAGIATKAAPHLRGEPGGQAEDDGAFWSALGRAFG